MSGGRRQADMLSNDNATLLLSYQRQLTCMFPICTCRQRRTAYRCMQACLYCRYFYAHMQKASYINTLLCLHHKCAFSVSHITEASRWQMSYIVIKNLWKIKNKCTMLYDCSLFWCQSYLNNQNELFFFSFTHSPLLWHLAGTGWQGVFAAEITRNEFSMLDKSHTQLVGVSNHFI